MVAQTNPGVVKSNIAAWYQEVTNIDPPLWLDTHEIDTYIFWLGLILVAFGVVIIVCRYGYPDRIARLFFGKSPIRRGVDKAPEAPQLDLIETSFTVLPAIVGEGHEIRPIILQAVNAGRIALDRFAFVLNAIEVPGRNKQYMSVELEPVSEQGNVRWFPGERLEMCIGLLWLCGAHSNGHISLLTPKQDALLVKELTFCVLSVGVHIAGIGSRVEEIKIRYDRSALDLQIYPAAPHRLEALDEKYR